MDRVKLYRELLSDADGSTFAYMQNAGTNSSSRDSTCRQRPEDNMVTRRIGDFRNVGVPLMNLFD